MNTTVIKTHQYKLKIVPDLTPANPRTEWDNLGTLVFNDNKYVQGDDDAISTCQNDIIEAWDEAKLGDMPALPNYDVQQLQALLEKSGAAEAILPVYLHVHSDVSIRTTPFTSTWDSGQVGFIYVTKKAMEKEKVTTELTLKCLGSEVKIYDCFIRGDVWGFQTYIDGEMIDSCYGFYGEPAHSGMREHLIAPFDALFDEPFGEGGMA